VLRRGSTSIDTRPSTVSRDPGGDGWLAVGALGAVRGRRGAGHAPPRPAAATLNELGVITAVPLAADEPEARQLVERRPPTVSRYLEIGLGTLTTRRSRRLRSGREQRVRRHGGGADEPAPGTGRPSSPSMAGIGPQTVILGDGRHPWPGRHHVWRRRLRTPIPDQLQSNSLPSRSIVR
jgi:hypothetical protein